MSSRPAPHSDEGVYGITVAAGLVGMEVQSLRLYESRGLLKPDRTSGGTRRYSADDLTRLRRIADLIAEGVNLTGIRMLLELQDENRRLRGQLDQQSRRPLDRQASRPTAARRPR
ncbi:MerR family transcriptional regulator [Terrabacter sp. BE26]|uniref:MerR family transcriptional regulator n=1 Tax=Terrabacter sp. BE26 TaxID=2898152 RepID=UPI0035BE8DCA